MSWMDKLLSILGGRRRIMCAAAESINNQEDRRKKEQAAMKECLVKLNKVNGDLKTAVTETKRVASEVTLKLSGLGQCQFQSISKPRSNGIYDGPERRRGERRTTAAAAPVKAERKKRSKPQQAAHVT